MKWTLPLLVAAWMIGEAVTFVVNPFHAPADQLPMRLFGLQAFKTQDDTMSPTVLAHRYVVITGWPYLHHSPERGDLVAFVDQSDASVLQFRRIVATGGSSIAIRHGVSFVDGQPQVETWLDAQTLESDRSQDMPPRQVPAGRYFVLGDNREISKDSREWGAIGRGEILGRKADS